jgi:hypothetical protein
MVSIEEKIRELEEEIRKTKYNKATQHHIGRLKARLARLKEEGERRGRGRGGGRGFGIRTSGDATVVIVGFPSVGKSTLLNRLTAAESAVGAYDFTTLDAVPGMMEYKGAKIQILDVPGLIEGASRGKGRGREVLSVIRGADLLLLMVDVFQPGGVQVLERELYQAGIRLHRRPPQVQIRKRERGGLTIHSTVELTRMSETTIREILAEYRIYSGEVLFREDLGIEEFLDAVSGNRWYLPSLTVLNKIDLVGEEEAERIGRRLKGEWLPISAEKGLHLEELRERIFDLLGLIRVYMRPPGGEPDLEEPLILRRGSRIADVCRKVHRELLRDFRYALVWGDSVKFEGQRVGSDHVLSDEDVVTIVSSGKRAYPLPTLQR